MGYCVMDFGAVKKILWGDETWTNGAVMKRNICDTLRGRVWDLTSVTERHRCRKELNTPRHSLQL